MNPWNLRSRTKLGFVLVVCRFPTTTTFKASAVDSPESSLNFTKHMDQAWIISQKFTAFKLSGFMDEGGIWDWRAREDGIYLDKEGGKHIGKSINMHKSV